MFRGEIRPMRQEDLAQVERIQKEAAEAAAWPTIEYLAQDATVAVEGGAVVAFAVCRHLGGGEHELLNVAVARQERRRGIASVLIRHLMERSPGSWFLEVRESNSGARALYSALGFAVAGRRKRYYSQPLEDAVVMSVRS